MTKNELVATLLLLSGARGREYSSGGNVRRIRVDDRWDGVHVILRPGDGNNSIALGRVGFYGLKRKAVLEILVKHLEAHHDPR